MLIANGITVQYRGSAIAALTGVDVSLQSGELVAVVGPNGSGKTTLQRALLGLSPLRSGQVTLDGKPLAEWSRRAISETIGALPQREEPAFPLTVYQAVLLGRWASLGPMSPVGPADESAVGEALRRCDLAGFASRSVETLSGGEWQRVRVARALAASPKFLLLDEPTASLDVGHEMELFELLRSLVQQGLGVLVITHHLNLAASFADRIVLLDRGQVAAQGSAGQVFTPDRLTGVFQWPVSVVPGPNGVLTIAPLRNTPASASPESHSTEGTVS